VVSAIPSAQKIAKICFMFFQISRWDIDPHVTKFAADSTKREEISLSCTPSRAFFTL
jgi:hypothetical protein